MGPNQSKNAGASTSASLAVKTSYYELLGIERKATDDEIKKAYRRRALDLHPDRNYGAEEDATKKFSEIQAAYEVLSDPQERAWYDSHESAILRGAEGVDTEEHFEHDVRVTTADEIVAMMGKFNGRVDFSDSSTGFFGFIREVFENLAREEEVAADWEGADLPKYPTFGHKDDTYEDVVKQFYIQWSGFSTVKAFAWKDKYRYNEAPDRKVRRMMEKENQKLRQEGIRDFNDAVRQLVLFVRRRDPRYTPNTQTDDDRAKAMKKATAAQAARQRAVNAAKISEAVPEWTKIQSSDEAELGEEELEEELEEQFECVACRKTFKSEKQWEGHERSKKHKQSLYALQKQMRKDNANLGLDEDVVESDTITPMEEEDEASSSESIIAEEDADSIPNMDAIDLDDEGGADETTTNKEAAPPTLSNTEVDSEPASSDENPDYASREQIVNRLAPSSNPLTSTGSEASLPIDPEPSLPPQKKLGAAAKKRLKKSTKEQPDMSANADEFKCMNCAAEFPSKTKLFTHLKDNPRHAAPREARKRGKVAGKTK